MSYRVQMTATARADLQEIADYFAETVKDPQKGKMQIRKLREIILALQEMPERYPLVRDEYLANKGYRMLPQDQYLIFYRILEKEKKIYISRILHGKRDWTQLL